MFRALMAVLLCTACSPSSGECLSLVNTAPPQIQARVDLHNTGCRADSDCGLTRASFRCYRGCDVAVLATEVADLEAELALLSESVCGSTSCEVNNGCAPAAARCMAGVCQVIEAPEDAGSADAGPTDGG